MSRRIRIAWCSAAALAAALATGCVGGGSMTVGDAASPCTAEDCVPAPSPDAATARPDAASAARDSGELAPDAGGAAPDAATAGPDAGGAAPDSGTVTPPTPLAACATAPLRTTGTVYYFCNCDTGAATGCAPGDDSGDGLTPAAAKRSWSAIAAKANNLAGGETIALCRTGAWASAGPFRPSGGTCSGGTGSWPPANDNATTCDFRDYVPSWGSAISPRPLLIGFQPAFGGTPSQNGWRFWNLDWRAPIDGRGATITNVTNLDFCNVNIESQTPPGCCDFACSAGRADDDLGMNTDGGLGNLSIRYSRIAGFSAQGFGGGNYDVFPSSILMEHSIFENLGSRRPDGNQCIGGGTYGAQNHSLYLWSPHDLTFRNNEVVSDGSLCGGNMVNIAGRTENLTFENNYIHVRGLSAPNNVIGGCNAYSNGSNASWSNHKNVTFRRNRVWTDFWGATFGCTDGGAVTDNLVSFLEIGNDARCFEKNPDGSQGAAMVSRDVAVLNNTIYDPMVWGGGLRIGTAGAGIVARNNAVYSPGDASHDYCFLWGNATESNNACALDDATATRWWASPMADLMTADFRPVPGGPLEGAGDPGHFGPIAIGTAAWDPNDPGVARVPPIDIGAYRR